MYYYIILLFLSKDISWAIDINFMAFGFFAYDTVYSTITDDFNKYAKENGIDIKVNLFLFSLQNTTGFLGDYDSTVDFLLHRKTKKYDLFLYDSANTARYHNYFEDLSGVYPKEFFEKFNENADKITIYKNKRVALVSI